MAIPGHVLTSFQVDESQAQPLGPEWGNGVRFGRIVVSAAPEHTAWSSKIREKVAVPGVRVVRPVRTTDGRFTVAGYRATDFVEGEPGHRVDEAISAALRFDDALSDVPAPTLERDDLWARADRAAWKGHLSQGKKTAGCAHGLPRVLPLFRVPSTRAHRRRPCRRCATSRVQRRADAYRRPLSRRRRRRRVEQVVPCARLDLHVRTRPRLPRESEQGIRRLFEHECEN